MSEELIKRICTTIMVLALPASCTVMEVKRLETVAEIYDARR